MARWTDIATWRGPTVNRGAGDQTEVRGLVVHIAEGWFEGTIAWQKNPDSDVSSHFVVARDGRIAQVVDTSDAAWTQRSGNGEWLSVECEGFTKENERNPGGWEKLTSEQLDAVARILLKCHQVYDVPLQTTSSTTGQGLGHHSMGADWGHQACPGRSIIAQKPTIVQRALALQNGDDVNLDDKVTLTTWAKERWDTLDSLDVDAALAHGYIYSRYNSEALGDVKRELASARLLQEAILAAFKGLNTNRIIMAINERAAEDAARDEATRNAVLGEIRLIASGGATAEEIIDELDRRLGNAPEPAPDEGASQGADDDE